MGSVRFTDEVPALSADHVVKRELAGKALDLRDDWAVLEVQLGGTGENIRVQRLPVLAVPCRYGGFRYYFKCPTLSCGRRVSKLYRIGQAFRCRHCHGLRYRTQYLRPVDRLLAKRDKACRQLGMTYGRNFTRPKGMWQSTFERLMERADAVELALHAYVTLRLSHM